MLTYEKILNEFLIKENLGDINYGLEADKKLFANINKTETNQQQAHKALEIG